MTWKGEASSLLRCVPLFLPFSSSVAVLFSAFSLLAPCFLLSRFLVLVSPVSFRQPSSTSRLLPSSCTTCVSSPFSHVPPCSSSPRCSLLLRYVSPRSRLSSSVAFLYPRSLLFHCLCHIAVLSSSIVFLLFSLLSPPPERFSTFTILLFCSVPLLAVLSSSGAILYVHDSPLL